jgi:hypothetical protein
VLHNSILISGTYSNAIEYRFPNTSAVLIANNVTDAPIVARDGATGVVTGNYTTASAIPAAGPDFDGEIRPTGATDIGADEYVPGGAPHAPQNLRIPGP